MIDKGFDRLGIMDVVSIASFQDACVVLPGLTYAIDYWPRCINAFIDRHSGNVKRSKTALVMGYTHRTLRLWVPYERDPTQPMDYSDYRDQIRHRFVFVSPFDRREAR